jgi:DNA polymerase I
MEREGIHLEAEKLSALKSQVQKVLESLEKTIHSLANKEFNCSSSKQLSEILFIDLAITPTGKKTKTGYSTNAEVLQNLKGKHPIIEPIIEFRTLNKLMSTYIEPLPLQINKKTARIHPTFKQAVAQTGRLSCTDPNLQNIPIKSALGKKVRASFTAKEGYSFISLDYSQIELRLVAHLSQDKTLLTAFKHGHDIHTQTAAIVYHCLEEQVTTPMRSSAKAINFGILYGQGPYGLAKELGISIKEAGAFIKAYFEKFSGVKSYIEQCIEKVEQKGASYSIMKRERKIPQINSSNHILKSLAHRLAINSPIQGSQADIIKLAMIHIDRYLKGQGQANLLLQIHDELVFECKDNLIKNVSVNLKLLMQNVISLDIPLDVDCKVAKNLGDF